MNFVAKAVEASGGFSNCFGIAFIVNFLLIKQPRKLKNETTFFSPKIIFFFSVVSFSL